jgi:hypothetical protein
MIKCQGEVSTDTKLKQGMTTDVAAVSLRIGCKHAVSNEQRHSPNSPLWPVRVPDGVEETGITDI